MSVCVCEAVLFSARNINLLIKKSEGKKKKKVETKKQ